MNKELTIKEQTKLLGLPSWQEPDDLGQVRNRIIGLGVNLHQHAYLVGKDLKWAKEKVGHGNFENWVESNVWFGIRTARNFMEFSDKSDRQDYLLEYHPKKDIKSATVADLKPIKGEYNVIVVDPPWAYGTEYDGETRRVASPYPEHPIDDFIDGEGKTVLGLRNWGIQEFEKSANEDSVIWLWTTHKFLPEAFGLLKDWGFEYKLTTVWDKQKMGMGSWLRCQVEFCLLGVKGDYHKFWNLTNERDIISVARREHSRKPQEFYDMVLKVCPQGNKIDIFSREKREGFEQYGNETAKFVGENATG